MLKRKEGKDEKRILMFSLISEETLREKEIDGERKKECETKSLLLSHMTLGVL